jgi:hypothetical protein
MMGERAPARRIPSAAAVTGNLDQIVSPVAASTTSPICSWWLMNFGASVPPHHDRAANAKACPGRRRRSSRRVSFSSVFQDDFRLASLAHATPETGLEIPKRAIHKCNQSTSDICLNAQAQVLQHTAPAGHWKRRRRAPSPVPSPGRRSNQYGPKHFDP